MTTGENEPKNVCPIRSAFIGKNQEYYFRAFDLISNGKTAWNWGSFLLGLGWMFYRKMYLYASIFGAFIIVESLAEIYFAVPATVTNLISFGFWIAFGLFGSSVYRRHLEKQVAEIEASVLSDEQKIELSARRGKPSIGIGFLGFFLFIGIFLGLVFLLPMPGM